MPYRPAPSRISQHRKNRDAEMGKARALAAQVALGEADEGTVARIKNHVALARVANRLYLVAKRIKELEGAEKASRHQEQDL